MTVILTTSPSFARSGPAAEAVNAEGWELIRCIDGTRPDGGASDHIEKADFLVVGLPPVNQATLASAERLKAVMKHGVGTDNIDIPACTAAGLPVTNTPGANANAVAELAVGLMFALARRIPQGHQSVTSGGWGRQVGSELLGKTLGIVGLGNIGGRLATLGRALGMRVVGTDPFVTKDRADDLGVTLLPLNEVLGQADYLSLHIFGGADNAALINAETLALMKPDACLLNLARGEVVDMDALANALQNNRLGGAAIDAYTVEPPDRSHPIFHDPRVIFTPHSGADTKDAVANMGLMVIEDIRTLIAGGMPARCLNAKDL